jgi:hypothetical protein
MKYFLSQKRVTAIALAIGATATIAMSLSQTIGVHAQQPQEAKSAPNQPAARMDSGGPTIDAAYPHPNARNAEVGMPGPSAGYPSYPAYPANPGGPEPYHNNSYNNNYAVYGYTTQPGAAAESKEPDMPLQGALLDELKKYMVLGSENTWSGRKMNCLEFEVEGTKVVGGVADEGRPITLANASSGLESVIDQLVAMHKQVESAERKLVYKKVATQVTDYLFQIQQQKRNTELEALENRLAKLKASSLKREQMSHQIIAKRVDELLGLTDGLAWSE